MRIVLAARGSAHLRPISNALQDCDVLNDGIEGIIVKARNVDQIAQAMIRAATNREENERMGHTAYDRGTKNNSCGVFVGRLLVIYEMVLEKTAGVIFRAS
jgi:glycosyltransferase involved in cell wall biosynthesis